MLAALTLSALAACSSAPAPKGLDQGAAEPSAEASVGGTQSGGAPVASGPGANTAGGAAVVKTTRNADGTVTTVTKDGRTIVTRNGKPISGPAARKPGTTKAVSTLFTPAEDKIGITDKQITMCAHAALIFGKAFNTTDADFNVFWDALNAEQGGIFGREVKVSYEDDAYSPTQAVTAARACKAKNPFLLIGGIGFDQIPAVRNYAEEQRIPYLHHTASVKGSQGLKYSFTPLPTVERTGEAFGQLMVSKYKGKKLGIIKRDGDNWEPGVVAFKAYAKRAGIQIVAEREVAANKANYTDEILEMKNKGAEVVWAWENALIATQIVAQAKRQNYNPNWLLFPFNLTSQNLGDDALKPKLDGVAMFTAYSKGDRGGSFASYADDLALFEKQYAKYRPEADLDGVGGDLLFLNWQAQKALYDILLACGRDCTRNRFVDTLTTYKKRPSSSSCLLDFTQGDRRHGSNQLVFMETYKSPSGKVNWRNTRACVGPDA